MIKTLIFDLDGTLLNTLDDLADSANWVCGCNGWPQHPTEAYKRMVGNGIPKLVERFSPSWAQDPTTLAGTLAQFKARYAAHKMDKTAPYPGIVSTLKLLRNMGIQLAVVSNKADGLCQLIVPHYFDQMFHLVRGMTDGTPAKPAPDVVYQVLQALHADPATTLLVGDSDVDVQTAHNAGLPAVGVSWGFRGAQELRDAGAEYIIDSPAMLLSMVQTINAADKKRE